MRFENLRFPDMLVRSVSLRHGLDTYQYRYMRHCSVSKAFWQKWKSSYFLWRGFGLSDDRVYKVFTILSCFVLIVVLPKKSRPSEILGTKDCGPLAGMESLPLYLANVDKIIYLFWSVLFKNINNFDTSTRTLCSS